jgi:hypothetical protein
MGEVEREELIAQLRAAEVKHNPDDILQRVVSHLDELEEIVIALNPS